MTMFRKDGVWPYKTLKSEFRYGSRYIPWVRYETPLIDQYLREEVGNFLIEYKAQ